MASLIEFLDLEDFRKGLPIESQRIIDDARTGMFQWIEKSRVEIEKRAIDQLEKEAEAIAKEIKTTWAEEDDKGLQELLNAVEAIRATNKTAEAVKNQAWKEINKYLSKRRDFWSGMGEKAAKLVIKAGKSMLGLPPQAV